jgi:predicted  nucleic acid-binding Zn-ribbon protein
MSEKEKTLKQRLESLEDEIRSLKYSTTRLSDSIEILDKAIRELIAINQLLIAKMKDSLIPILKADLEPKRKLDKEVK